MEKTDNIIGSNIRRMRELAGLSQLELAKLVSLRPQAINRIENGRAQPRKSNLDLIAKHLNCAVEDFFKVHDESKTGPALAEIVLMQEKEIAALKQEIAQMKSSALMVAYEKATPRVRALTIQFLADMTRIEAEDAARLQKESALNSLDSKNKKVSGR